MKRFSAPLFQDSFMEFWFESFWSVLASMYGRYSIVYGGYL